jgi:hypothetical protein
MFHFKCGHWIAWIKLPHRQDRPETRIFSCIHIRTGWCYRRDYFDHECSVLCREIHQRIRRWRVRHNHHDIHWRGKSKLYG